MPVLVANGDSDPMILPHYSYLLGGLIPQARVKIYPDSPTGSCSSTAVSSPPTLRLASAAPPRGVVTTWLNASIQMQFDLPGLGHSQRRDALLSPQAMGKFVIRVADAFGLESPHVVGPDIGTAGGLFAAARPAFAVGDVRSGSVKASRGRYRGGLDGRADRVRTPRGNGSPCR
jgi:hypothetical protein